MIWVKTSLDYVDVAVGKLLSFEGVEVVDMRIEFEVEGMDWGGFYENSAGTAKEFVEMGFGGAVDERRLGEGQMVGDYYVTSMISYDYARDKSFGRLRVVAKRDGSGWTLAAQPRPLLTVFNAEGVPRGVIEAANRL